MKSILKQFAEANDIKFIYARADFQNLYDGVHDNGVIMFLDPLQSSENLGPRGNTESVDWSGSFLLSVSSDIDSEDYETRYEQTIKPIVDGKYSDFKQFFKCRPEISIESLKTTEVINSLDFNVDGLSVNFVIREWL